MKKLYWIALTFTAFCLMSCHQKINVTPPAPEFVEALSSGVWSRKEPIVVVFTNTIPHAEPGRPLSVSPFSLTQRFQERLNF